MAPHLTAKEHGLVMTAALKKATTKQIVDMVSKHCERDGGGSYNAKYSNV